MTVAEVPRAVRRPAAAARVAARRSATWTWRRRIQAVDRRGHAADRRGTCTTQTGMKNLVPGRRRGAELRGQRPAPARRAVRRHLDPAGRRRRRRRARRGAVRLASAARTSRASRTRRDCQQRLAARPGVRRRRDRARSSSAPARRITRRDDDDELLDDVAELLADGQGRRLVPGPDGVRPAGARRAQHPRRPAQRRRCRRR